MGTEKLGLVVGMDCGVRGVAGRGPIVGSFGGVVVKTNRDLGGVELGVVLALLIGHGGMVS